MRKIKLCFFLLYVFLVSIVLAEDIKSNNYIYDYMYAIKKPLSLLPQGEVKYTSAELMPGYKLLVGRKGLENTKLVLNKLYWQVNFVIKTINGEVILTYIIDAYDGNFFDDD